MTFVYRRTVHFHETDAAGVVFFANIHILCHEAYEASLAEVGIDLKTFFGGMDVAIPITHASVDFFRPLCCGDRLLIHLTPTQTRDSEFEIAYKITLEKSNSSQDGDRGDRPASQAKTRHVCINSVTRTRQDLPESLLEWLRRWAPSDPQTESNL